MTRELRLTKIEGRIYLFPVPVVKERKYLIFCDSEDDAKAIIEGVQNKNFVHPDLVSDDFLYLTHHTDRQTKIYVLNPNSKSRHSS